MKGNLMVRLMTLLILTSLLLAHFNGQTNLISANWLWLAIIPAFMGLQATFTGWCPAGLLGKLSKTGECCPQGSCSSRSKPLQETRACCNGKNTTATDSMQIKVLGTGCANCTNTAKLIEKTAREQGVAANVIKIEDISEIAAYGVMSTPAVVIDDKVVHSGGVPDKNTIAGWLSH